MESYELYQKVNSAQRRDGINFLKNLESRVKWSESEFVLDVGCGPGDFTAGILSTFLPNDAAIVGCDISKTAVDYANTYYAPQYSKMTFRRMDIEGLDIWDEWEKETFTKIYSFYCFHWIHSLKLSSENMHSLLKPGGDIHLIFLAEHPMFIVFSKLLKSKRWKEFLKDHIYYPQYMSGNTEERGARIFEALSNAGFDDVQINTENHNYQFPTFDYYISSMKAIDAYRKHIPDNHKDDYDAYMMKEIKKGVLINSETAQTTLFYQLFTVNAKKK